MRLITGDDEKSPKLTLEGSANSERERRALGYFSNFIQLCCNMGRDQTNPDAFVSPDHIEQKPEPKVGN